MLKEQSMFDDPDDQPVKVSTGRGDGAAGSCRRCGRMLKNPASVEAGIGPVCARRENVDTTEEVSPEEQG